MRDLLDKLKVFEGFDPDEFEGEFDYDGIGDDGEETPCTVSYTAKIEDGRPVVDPDSLSIDCVEDGNSKLGFDADMDLEMQDKEELLKIAQEDAEEEWANRDNKYAHGESIADSHTQTEDKDRIIFKGKEIDLTKIDYTMRDFSDGMIELNSPVFYTDGTEVDDEDLADLNDMPEMIDWMMQDYMDNRAPQEEGEVAEDKIKPGQGALDKFRELYRKGIGSDDAEVVLRELIEVINDDSLWSDEFPQLKQFTSDSPHSGSRIVTAKDIPGNSADEKIESLLKEINDEKWVEDFAEMLMKDFSMDENADLDRIKELSGLDTNEEDEQTFEGEEFYEYYGYLPWHEDVPVDEAEYRGRKVPLGKPMRGDVKKFKVYVRDPKTKNVKKVNFGDPNMRIKKSNPKRRKSFRARHNCSNPGPRTKARYWSCRKW